MHRIAFVLSVAAAVAACGGKSDQPSTMPTEHGDHHAGAGETGATTAADTTSATGATATATLEPRSGSSVKGTVTFRAVADGVEVTAELEGLTPGEHAWHVHANGDCSAPDGKSAGDHFNPTGQPHGGPDADARHAGDFGNLTAGDDGRARKTLVVKGITLGEGETSVLGKGFIVHEKADDLTSQPSGNAGGRVACGVIEASAP